MRGSVWGLQGMAYGIQLQEHVGRVLEVLVDKCGRGCRACCWGWLQLVHVTAELLYEGGCFERWGGWYKELTRDPQGLNIGKLCHR